MAIASPVPSTLARRPAAGTLTGCEGVRSRSAKSRCAGRRVRIRAADVPALQASRPKQLLRLGTNGGAPRDEQIVHRRIRRKIDVSRVAEHDSGDVPLQHEGKQAGQVTSISAWE